MVFASGGLLMDIFCEQSVFPARRQGGAFRLAMMVFCGLCVLICLTVIGMLARGLDLILVAILIVFGGGGVAAYLLRDSRDIEYDLTLLSDELRCDRIIGHRRRKPLFVAPTGSWEGLGSYNEHSNNAEKTYLLAFGETDLHALVFRDGGRRCAAVWKPTEEMQKALKRAGARVLRV